jgi:signal transduction histidine kinase
MENTVLPRRARLTEVVASGHAGGTPLALIAWASTVTLVAAALLLGSLTPDFLLPLERSGTVFLLVPCLLSLANSSVGALIVSRPGRERVGWAFCAVGLLYGVRNLAQAYADYALLAHPGLPLGDVAAWTSTWLRLPMVALVVLVVLLFPDGRLLSTRWRPVVWTAGAGAVLVACGDAFRFGPLPIYYYANNPFGLGGASGETVSASGLAEASALVGVALLLTGCLASIVALAIRLGRAHDAGRRHLWWFACAAVPALAGWALGLMGWGVERWGTLFPGGPSTPMSWIAEHSFLFANAGQAAGTLSELRLAANLELASSCALLLMPVVAYVGTRDSGRYGAGRFTTQWWRVLLGGAIAGALPLAFVYLAVFLYVIFYPLAGRGQPGQDHLTPVVVFVSGWGALVSFVVATSLVAYLVARKSAETSVVLGTSVGLVASCVQAISSVFDPPVIPGGVFSYLCLGLAGGYFGGLAGRSTLSGGVYRVSRQLGGAGDASAVAAAIGENLGDVGIEGVAIWRKDNPEDGAAPAGAPGDAPGDGPRTVLWGSWSVDGDDGWPPGLDAGEAGGAMLAVPGGRSWAMVRRSALAPEKRKAWERLGVRSALLVPLGSPEGAWRGLLMVAFQKRWRLSGRTARAYLTVASQAAVVLENLRLVEEARRAGRRRGVLVERQRMAREIHDTLAQGFTGVITNLTAAELAGDPDLVDGPTARYIHDAKRIARDSLTEARRLVWALRPAALDRYPLPEAVRDLVAGWSEQTGVEAVVATNGVPRELLPEAEAALLRTVQEALTNVHKHARAGTVNVTLTCIEDQVVVDVVDDGEGFDPATLGATVIGAQDEGGFGLIAMRERIEQLGGKLVVESTPGEGTAIVAELRAAGGEEDV